MLNLNIHTKNDFKKNILDNLLISNDWIVCNPIHTGYSFILKSKELGVELCLVDTVHIDGFDGCIDIFNVSTSSDRIQIVKHDKGYYFLCNDDACTNFVGHIAPKKIITSFSTEKSLGKNITKLLDFLKNKKKEIEKPFKIELK